MAKHPHNSKRPVRASARRALDNGDVEAVVSGLSVRQRRFAEEYVIDFNGSAAAIRAGYAVTYSDRQAHLLLKHDAVRAYIDELTRTKENKITSVNPDYVLQRITAIINKEEAKDGDKLRGLELLARHLGMLTDKTEITGKDGGPLSIEQAQRIEEEAQSFTNALEAMKLRAEKDKKEVTLLD